MIDSQAIGEGPASAERAAGLRAEALSVRLAGAPVLRAVDAELAPGEVLGLVGPNGAGKTTLLRVMAGVLPCDEGRVSLDGRPLDSYERRALARALSYLPQGGTTHWAVSVETLVMMGRLPHLPAWQGPSPRDREAVQRALREVDVDYLARRPVTQLSGGERARVLLARALAGEPRVLLADEPVAGLDPYHRLEVMEHLCRLADEGKAVAVVLHDLSLAMRFCHRVLLLDAGRVVCEGPPESVFDASCLAQVYRVAAISGRHDGEPYLLPWRRLGLSNAPQGEGEEGWR